MVRADGSDLSRTANSDLWHDSFNRMKPFPGDTLVVQDKTFAPQPQLEELP